MGALFFFSISLEDQGWISYVACGVQGVLDINKELKKFTQPKNMLITVFSNLPISAGLSSSSALVCAAFLATCVLNDVSMLIFSIYFAQNVILYFVE